MTVSTLHHLYLQHRYPALQLNMIKLLDHSLGIQFTLVKTLFTVRCWWSFLFCLVNMSSLSLISAHVTLLLPCPAFILVQMTEPICWQVRLILNVLLSPGSCISVVCLGAWSQHIQHSPIYNCLIFDN